MIGSETGLSLEIVIALISAIITIGVSGFVAYRWLVGTLRQSESEARLAREKLNSEHSKALSDIRGEISQINRDFSAFRLEVAKYYASSDRLAQTEKKLETAIDRLINRFDQFATDFHKALTAIGPKP